MTKDTLRDTVWREIIKQRDDDSRILKPDIQQRVDAGDRTVHDVLQTAVEYRLLDRSTTIEDRDDPRTEDSTQRKEVVVFDPAELDDWEVDDDTVPLDDDKFTNESGDNTSNNGEDADVGEANSTPDDDNSETISVPESDLDDNGFIDEDWPDASPGHYAANLDGIGKKKSRRLHNKFEAYEDIIRSSIEEITTVDGIGESTAIDIKHKIMKLSFRETKLNAEDLPEVETKVVADMFNVPEDLAETFQSQLLLHRDVYENASVE
jgi:hypothetical protein